MAILILTMIGDDRTGLVDTLSGVIEAHGGNWEQSRMAHLENKFAGVVKIRVADGRAGALGDALRLLDADGTLQVSVERGDAGAGAGAAAGARELRLALLGQDQPGIVHDIAHALAECGVGIEEMQSDTEAASMGGGTLFRAALRLRVPGHVAADDLRAVLEGLANELMVDVSLGETED